MILGAAPIKECIDYAIEFEDFGDPDLSDFGFHYLDDRGNYTPMSWEDYDSWLERQKVIDGPYL
ncbi:MAG: hypothetical protein B0W54_17520 [Cellvibrio sp. 79]|nr:MAG: hypothetical protein B0W54_17520 [Cellvibrio sp. 79]